MSFYSSTDRKLILEQKFEDFIVISFMLKKYDIEIPDQVVNELKLIENELRVIEEVYEKYNQQLFYKTFFSEQYEKEITFKILTTGDFIIDEDVKIWLLGINPNTGTPHLIKLKNDYTLDNDWMNKNGVILEDDYLDDYFDDYDYYDGWVMPCDMDPSECGVTCFNCPRGN